MPEGTGIPPAVILGGSANAVVIARSLGRAGVPVFAVGGRSSRVQYSRFCRGFANLGTEGDFDAAWLSYLAVGPRGAVLLPAEDGALEFVARHRYALEALGHRTIEANDNVLLAMTDKARTYELARAMGIRAPQTFTVASPDDLEAAVSDAPCPGALKPVHSHRFAEHFPGQKLIAYRDRQELRRLLERILPLGLLMLITEVVPGPPTSLLSYYSYLDREGQPLFHFMKQEIRQYPLDFGLGCYRISVRDSELAEVSLRFFQGIGLRGPGQVEFKRDARDGKLTIIECNARMGANIEHLRLGGIDLALLCYERALGRPGPRLPAMHQYRTGIRMWNPIPDTRSLVALRRRRALTVWGWIRSLVHPVHSPVFNVSDPWPTVAYHVRLLGRLDDKLRRRRNAAVILRGGASNRSTGYHAAMEPGAGTGLNAD